MKKKLLALTVVAAMLISLLSLSSVFAAAEPSYIWKPAEDGYAAETLGTAADAEDGSYTTFTSMEGQPEGYTFPGANMQAAAGEIDPADGSYALVKYRTSAVAEVQGEILWLNTTNTAFSVVFPYTTDGAWHFAIVDLNKEGKWSDMTDLAILRFDFLNNTSNNSYSLDLAYLAIFASEADAQAYADADGQGTVPPPADPSDPTPTPNPGKEPSNPSQPPKTGDVSMIVAVAAAGLILTVVLKKRLRA